MEIVYIEGNDTDYVLFVKNLKEKAVLTAVEGKQRWVVTREDGTQYIVRPVSAKENEQSKNS